MFELLKMRGVALELIYIATVFPARPCVVCVWLIDVHPALSPTAFLNNKHLRRLIVIRTVRVIRCDHVQEYLFESTIAKNGNRTPRLFCGFIILCQVCDLLRRTNLLCYCFLMPYIYVLCTRDRFNRALSSL